MSQAGIISTRGGIPPPTVATSYVTDVNSPAIPALNVLNVLGNDTTANNDNGIRTDGSSGSNTLTVQLTNRITGSATTTDDVTPVSVYSFALTPLSTYILEIQIVGYNVTDALALGFNTTRVIRTTGVAAVLISANPGITSEEGAMTGVLVVNDISGISATLTVTGLSGKTIHWKALVNYITVS